MNNTKTLTAIVAVLTAATLVVGVTFAATPSASAYGDKSSVIANVIIPAVFVSYNITHNSRS